MKRCLVPVVALSFSFAACAPPERADAGATNDQSLVGDAVSIQRRPDGNFDVVCADGRHEIATATQISSNGICSAATAATDQPAGGGPNDPFSADACAPSSEWTLAAVEAKLPPGSLTAQLPATVFVRVASADCALRTDGSTSCTPWRDVPSANLRQGAVSLAIDPEAKTFSVEASAWAAGSLTMWINSCRGESGDLCPTSLEYSEEDFGVRLTKTTFTGHVGAIDRNPASILIGQATRTAVPESEVPVHHNPYKFVQGYSLGSVDIDPGEYDRVRATHLDAAVPDSQATFGARSARFTTSCGVAFVSSPHPAATTFTKTVGAVLFRY